MDFNEITYIIADAAKKIRKWQIGKIAMRPVKYDPKFKYDAWISQMPDFTPAYKYTILEHEKIAAHAEPDYFPWAILRSKAPNQDDAEWSYQMNLYESVTNSDWGRALNKTKAVGNKQNYRIEFADDEQKKYFYNDYPAYESVEAFFLDIVREEKINYPNKVLVVEPERYYFLDVTDENGEVIGMAIDDTRPIDPVVRIYDEWQVVQFKERVSLTLLVSMDEEYKDSTGNLREDGLKFRVYDTTSIWEITQTGLNAQMQAEFTYQQVYIHDWGWLPANRLKGAARNVGGETYYQSAFVSAVPDLNEVIRMNSTAQVSTHTLAFPVRIMVVDPCNFNDGNGNSCSGGSIYNPIEGKYSDCPACKGSGKKSLGPTGVIEVLARDARPGAPAIELPTDPLKFVSPDPAILEHLDRRIEKHRAKAFSMFFETDKASAETATGKQLEKEEWQTFMVQFARELFGLMGFAIEAIGHMKFGADFAGAKLYHPKTFNFRTPESITMEIAEAKKNGLPVTYQKALLMEATETRFGADNSTMSDIELQMDIDRVFYMSPMEVRANVGVTISEVDALLHQNFATYLQRARGENEAFDELDNKAKMDILEGYAKEDYLVLNPALVEVDGGAAMAGGAMDSTAALRGSVGGLTGMIEIVKAVASGLYDLEAAVRLVMDRFGLSEEQARAQLGTPNVTASDIETAQQLNV